MKKSTTPAPAKKGKAKTPASAEAREVPTRDIPRPVESMLWGHAAGRCEFDGCNQRLSRSPVTQEQVNTAEKAHIYAFSADGPRGNAGIADEDLNDADNLMLVCHACHQTIDQVPDGGRYTVPLLRGMKERHERRIEIVTGITPGRASHVLFYGANIGQHTSPFAFGEAAGAMFPDRYPAEAAPIALGTVNSAFQDPALEFWDREGAHLRNIFERRVRERIADRAIDHLSVFALAPQPLLVLLGSLLGDITPTDVYQRHREPPTWAWPASATAPAFEVHEPAKPVGPPALVLALSATITTDRITSVLGDNATIWTVTVPKPHNDVMKSREQLSQFRALLRPLLDCIKAVHGQTTPLHFFPAAPVSAAVEFGRVRMPKADTAWVLYDQVGARRGFVPTITLPQGS